MTATACGMCATACMPRHVRTFSCHGSGDGAVGAKIADGVWAVGCGADAPRFGERLRAAVRYSLGVDDGLRGEGPDDGGCGGGRAAAEAVAGLGDGRAVAVRGVGGGPAGPAGVRAGGDMGDMYLAYLRDPADNKICALLRIA